MKDVKKKHLEEIAARKIEEIRIEEERKLHNEIYDKWKSNWRDELELEEGMTVAGSFLTTEPAEGDTDLSSVDVNNANSYVNTITSSEDGGFIDPSGSSYNQGVGFFTNGSGTGGVSGFNFGSDYIGFAFPPNQTFPSFGRAEIKAQDLSSIDSIVANVIRGNDSNGGQPPLDGGTKGLRIQYKIDGMDTFKELNVKPDGTTDSSVSNILIPGFGEGGTAFDTPNNVIVTIPEYVRTKTTQLRLITNDVGFHPAPVYGVNNFRFQRRAPINVFVSLDSPEATSFVRLGGKESDPKKRRKNVEDILRAGQRYTDKTFDTNFPGSTTELSPEASPEISSPDQDVADTQQQNRDSMDQKTKLNYDVSEKTDRLMKLLYDATKGQSGIDKESVKRAYSIAANPADYIGQTYTASDGKVYTVGGKGDFQRTRTYNRSIHDPRSPDYKPGATPEFVKERYISQTVNAMLNDIKQKLSKAFWSMDYSDRTERMSVQSDVYNALSVPSFDLDDKGNPIMASSLDLPMLDLLKSDEYRLKQEYQNRKSGRGNAVYNRDFPRGYTKGVGGMDYRGNYVRARGVKESLTYSKIKNKILKDVRPEFPTEPPPQIDPKTGMHPLIFYF